MSRTNGRDFYFEDEDEPTQNGSGVTAEFRQIDREAAVRRTHVKSEEKYEVEVFESVADRLSSLTGN
jgi:hypothetical protein